MGRLDVGIEAGLARPDLEHGDGAQVGQVVERLVHGLERDVRHLVTDPLVHPLGRRMGHVALEGPEDALALGRDFATVGPEQIGQRVGRLHGNATLAGAGPFRQSLSKCTQGGWSDGGSVAGLGASAPRRRPEPFELAHGEEATAA